MSETSQFVIDFMTQMVDLRLAVAAQNEAIQAAKDELRRLKDLADDLTMTVSRDAPDRDTALAMLSILYWQWEGTVSGTTVAHALKMIGLDRSDILPHKIELDCPRCGSTFSMEVTTRTEMTRVSGGYEKCGECDAEIEAEYKAQTAVYRQQEQARQAEIERLRSMPYTEYLQTEHWQDVRRRALKRSGFKCQLCNAGKTALHVHHRTYKNRGCEENSDVITLCANCHSTFHDKGELSHD